MVLDLHTFSALALDGGKRSVSRAGRKPPVFTGWKAGWAPEPVITAKKRNISAPVKILIQILRSSNSQSSQYTDHQDIN
jgi:hypothetical protein